MLKVEVVVWEERKNRDFFKPLLAPASETKMISLRWKLAIAT